MGEYLECKICGSNFVIRDADRCGRCDKAYRAGLEDAAKAIEDDIEPKEGVPLGEIMMARYLTDVIRGLIGQKGTDNG